jgi:hypothetical protein
LERIVLVPVKLTVLGKVRGFAPVTVMLLPTWMRAALVKVRLVRAFVPPTAPANDTLPTVPARSVKAVAPLRVLKKLMRAPVEPPALVLSKVGALLIVTGPVIVIVPPVVVMLPPTLMELVPV